MSQDKAATESVIRPNQSWITIDVKGLIAYKDLIFILISRDFTARYKQTVLGPIWFFINPIITTLTFTLVFNRIIGISTDGIPPLLFYMSGTLIWNYFSQVLGTTSNSLAGNTHLFAKVYFPRLIPPLAQTISSLMSFGVQFVTFLGFYAYYLLIKHEPTIQSPSLNWLFLPLIVLHAATISRGAGLILSALTAKYKDLQQVQSYFLGLLIYVTPVIYPLSAIGEKWSWLANLNPMTAVVETTRGILLGGLHFHQSSYFASAAVSVSLLLIGIFSYQSSARTFVDTV